MPVPKINLTDRERKAVVDILQGTLADEYTLYTKTLNYHWNVESPQFNGLHNLFEEQYKQLLIFVDDTAERIRALGYRSPGSMKEFLKDTGLKENTTQITASAMIKDLLNDHEAIIRALRVDLQTCADDHNDMGTNNFLNDLLMKHEKIAWMLRSMASK